MVGEFSLLLLATGAAMIFPRPRKLIGYLMFIAGLAGVGYTLWPRPANEPSTVIAIPGPVYNVGGVNSPTAYVAFMNSGAGVATADWTISIAIAEIGRDPKTARAFVTKDGPVPMPPGGVIIGQHVIYFLGPGEDQEAITAALRTRGMGVYVFGTVAWRNGSGPRLETGFCWIFTGPEAIPYLDRDGVLLAAYTGDKFTTCNAGSNYVARETS